MNLIESILEDVGNYLKKQHGLEVKREEFIVNPTRKEFEGEYTIVVFPLSGRLKKSPEEIGTAVGDMLVHKNEYVDKYQLVKGFLNLTFTNDAWIKVLGGLEDAPLLGDSSTKSMKYVLEYSSPNTNKPLHLGHIRNILLGWSVARLLQAVGHEVHRTQVINDRGIAICKSMVAWKKFGGGVTPADKGIKGDHFVGDYYIRFEKAFKQEYVKWQQSAEGDSIFEARAASGQDRDSFFREFKNRYFNEYSELGAEARIMLRNWEAGDEKTVELWKEMNAWVYQGFEETFERLGVKFDSVDYESETYLIGKEIVEEGIGQGIFYRKSDGSVWVDLTDKGLDQKLLLRSDGTAVYMTQDLGTARMRYKKHRMDGMIYTVADEQNYHFQALFAILEKMGEPYAAGLHHLSYGMVDLPSGRMKSREGTVVDADELMDEVVETARINAEERGELSPLPKEEQNGIIRKIGMGALKYHILKVDPRKRMVFNPEESVDLQGQTGPYIQNAYVRIRSVLRKAERKTGHKYLESYAPDEEERDILRQLAAYTAEVETAARQFDPALIANYAYALARSYHKFYHDHPILRAESDAAVAFRISLSKQVARVLKSAMGMLGIEMPEKM